VLGTLSILGLFLGALPGLDQDTLLPMTAILPVNVLVGWVAARRPAWPKTRRSAPVEGQRTAAA